MIDVYLAIPYSKYSPHEREWIFHTVNIIAARYIQRGLTVISPISHSHPIAKYGLSGDFKIWEKLDLEFLEICKSMHIICIPGYAESTGLNAEREYCREHGKPVLEITEFSHI